MIVAVCQSDLFVVGSDILTERLGSTEIERCVVDICQLFPHHTVFIGKTVAVSGNLDDMFKGAAFTVQIKIGMIGIGKQRILVAAAGCGDFKTVGKQRIADLDIECAGLAFLHVR